MWLASSFARVQLAVVVLGMEGRGGMLVALRHGCRMAGEEEGRAARNWNYAAERAWPEGRTNCVEADCTCVEEGGG
eukprot:CAMPEP_0185733302 /NCGR_PEP_ID=MMETSP1171-20130828/19055_1 /TAXON_ID=374046 /ORGANISM="Helicotheca tamensis, Strain CCMP826" /LENGTH=75 /DNA_ID=CAMNT_0028402993 /DNA_START=74 /DNA_END=301 /DNA_ORIENTATION=-